MDKLDNQSLIHKGHRKRMKDKLLMHGPNIFDTYELLEMLLYTIIPYRDTNPTAKRLLARFGSLSGVLAADPSELMEVDGIGERAARLLSLVGKYESVTSTEGEFSLPTFDSYHAAGRYFVDLFSDKCTSCAAMLLLDNSMRLIDFCEIKCESFGSAAVRPRLFLDEVARVGASNVLVACNHRYGSLFLSDSEIATYKSVKMALSEIYVDIPACFVVSGKNYTKVELSLKNRLFSSSVEHRRFVESLQEGVYSVE